MIERLCELRAPTWFRPARAARRRAAGRGAVVVAAVLLGAAQPRAQFEKMISTTFDGWNKLSDGSYELVFGYINRNSSEVEVALGPGNAVEPAPADHGQPTNFLPGRQRAAFRIPVPAGFKGKYVWTLTYGGMTQTANASIDQNYSLDVGDPEPPQLQAGPDQSIALAGVARLAPVVSAPKPPPEPVSADVVPRRSAGARITVWWSKFRGPGRVTFGDGAAAETAPSGPTGREVAMGTFRVTCTTPLTAGCGATSARFSAPGTYWLRVVAAERSASNAIMKVVVAP